MEVINNLRKNKWAIIFVIYLRYLIGASFVFASVVKIQGNRFTTDDGIDQPINSAWHLFETLYQSGLYWKFLGWSQLIAGLILMTQRFAALGAALFLPVSINIFVITISYSFAGTPIITGLILLANIFLVIWDYKKFASLLNLKNTQTENKASLNDSIAESNLWSVLGLALFATTVIYVLIYGRNPVQWSLICFALGLTGIIIHNIRYKLKNG